MSAKIPVNMEIKDLLKATGYDCPEDLQGKTFNEATSGSGGSGGGRDKFYLYWWSYGVDYSNTGTSKIYNTAERIVRFVYLKNIPDFSNAQPNQTFELYYYGQGNVVKDTVKIDEVRSDTMAVQLGTNDMTYYLIRVTDSSWSKFDYLDEIPLLQNIEITENKTFYPEKNYMGAGEIKINVPAEPMNSGNFAYPLTQASTGATCQTSKMHISNYTDTLVYFMLYTGSNLAVTKKMSIADLETGSQTISFSYGAGLDDTWKMKVKVSFESETTQQGSLVYWLKAEVLDVGSKFYSNAVFSIGYMK